MPASEHEPNKADYFLHWFTQFPILKYCLRNLFLLEFIRISRLNDASKFQINFKV